MSLVCEKACEMVAYCSMKCNDNLSDNDLFQVIYNRYKHSIFNFFYQKTKQDRTTAEDLTQEFFIKIFNNMSKIKEFCNITGWLFTIASNVYIDYQRKISRRPEGQIYQNMSSNRYQGLEDTPLQDLLRIEMKQNFQYLLNCLPSNYRLAILLREQQNLSYAEASKLMGLSLTAYTSLLTRARIGLKELFIAHLLGVNKDSLTKHEYSAFSKWFIQNKLCDDISEPIKKGMLDYFNERADFHNAPRYIQYHNFIDNYIIHKYSLNKKQIVADYGMGTGIFTSKLSKFVKRVDGYDYSKEMCVLAGKSFKDKGIQNVFCKNIDFLELKDNLIHYDYSFCITVLHHIAYPQKAIDKIVSMLKKGGGLVISDFAKHNYLEFAEDRKDLWYGFTHDQFTTFLTNAGLKNVWVEIHNELPMLFRTKSGKLIKIGTIIGGGQK